MMTDVNSKAFLVFNVMTSFGVRGTETKHFPNILRVLLDLGYKDFGVFCQIYIKNEHVTTNDLYSTSETSLHRLAQPTLRENILN